MSTVSVVTGDWSNQYPANGVKGLLLDVIDSTGRIFSPSITATGEIRTDQGFFVSDVEVIDSSRNLKNISNVSISGGLTLSNISIKKSNATGLDLQYADGTLYRFLRDRGTNQGFLLNMNEINCETIYHENIVVRDGYSTPASIRRVTMNTEGIQMNASSSVTSGTIIPNSDRSIDMVAETGNITANGAIRTNSEFNVNGNTIIDTTLDLQNISNITASGTIRTNQGFRVNDQTIIDSSRRLTNVYPSGSIYDILRGKIKIVYDSVYPGWINLDNRVSYEIPVDKLNISTNDQDLPMNIDICWSDDNPIGELSNIFYHHIPIFKYIETQYRSIPFLHRHNMTANTIVLNINISNSIDIRFKNVEITLIYQNINNVTVTPMIFSDTISSTSYHYSYIHSEKDTRLFY